MADGASVNMATTAEAVLHSVHASGDPQADAEAVGTEALSGERAAATGQPGAAPPEAPASDMAAPAEIATPAASAVPATTAVPAGAAAPAVAAPAVAAPVMSAPAMSAPGASAAPARPRQGGRLFGAVCALLSLAGAGVALTAPALRPQAFELARVWLGDDSPVLRYLASPASDVAPSMLLSPAQPPGLLSPAQPPGLLSPAQPPAAAQGAAAVPAGSLAALRAELIATLRLELASVRRAASEQADHLKSIGAAVQSVQGEAVSARGDARAATGAAAAAAAAAARAQADAARAQEAAARALDGTRDRFDRLDAQVATFDARVRATGLVVTAGQLRHDIEAGAPLNDDLVAIGSSGPLPAPVQRALDQLSQAERGVPTARDLAVGFETLDAEIGAHRSGQGSWTSLGGLFGSAAPDRETLDRVRALAAEGRFSEVADLLERSEWADSVQAVDRPGAAALRTR